MSLLLSRVGLRSRSIMAKKKQLSNLVVMCEWASCTFKGTSMEELSEHMSLHLKDHLGEGDAMEELGGHVSCPVLHVLHCSIYQERTFLPVVYHRLEWRKKDSVKIINILLVSSNPFLFVSFFLLV